MELSELLAKQDVDGFNARRRVSGRIDLFAADLAGLVLHGVDLSGANLDKADLTGADLTDGRLAKAFASEIDATGACLKGVLGLMVKMKNAVLDEADLSGADLSRADLSGSELGNSRAHGTKLVGARLKGIQAAGASWPQADLSEATLSEAVFTGADLASVSLKEAAGSEVQLERANLNGCNAGKARLSRSKLAGATLRGAVLTDADLSDCDLTGADLTGADLSRAKLSGAILTGAVLTGCVLVDAVLDGATTDAASWEGADLTGVDVAALGLSAEVVATLKGSGARFDAEADILYADASVAVSGSAVGVSWLNPDSESFASLRWAVRTGGRHASGILAVSAEAVLAHTILPFQGAFAVVVLVERSGGPTVMRWALSLDGELAPPVTTSLGFEPAVLPVWEAADGRLRMWTLSRRGPSVVLLVDAGEGFQVVSSEARPQATGFAGQRPPVLACKAGVLVPIRGEQLGAPLRAPDGFPAPVSATVPLDDKVAAVWLSPKQGKDPGGLRFQWLGERLPREPEVLTKQPAVRALAGMRHGDEAALAWIERGVDADVLAVGVLPGGIRDRFVLPGEGGSRWRSCRAPTPRRP
jgi:uncharacterized protein YjbI with pentapeptide repeats